MSEEEGTRVANGQHVVPKGIAVETFSDNFKMKLKNATPPAVAELMEAKELLPAYQKLVAKATSGDSKVFSDVQLIRTIQEYQPQFQEKGVRLAVCRFTTNMGNYRWFWLEFIDTTVVPATYVPIYDISNYQLVLEGKYAIPPKGVAVEKLSDWSASKLVKECPPEVEEMLVAKGLSAEYDKMVNTLKNSKSTRSFTDAWKTTEVAAILRDFQPTFEQRGIDLVVCKMSTSDGWETVKWLEFTDVELAPDHVPPYDVDFEMKSERSRTTSVRSTSFFGADVATEELITDGIITVQEECPSEVAMLLETKGIPGSDYANLDQVISQCKSMRNFTEVWRLVEQGIIEFPTLQEVWNAFANKGVKLLLCESLGQGGKSYWIEYVDMTASPDYSTPYNVAYAAEYNEAPGVEKKTTDVAKGWLTVPEGVYVEGLNGVKKLSDECPAKVREFLNQKGVSPIYDQFIDAVVKSKKTRNWAKSWKSAEIVKILKEYRPQFQARGVNVVLCKITPDGGQEYRWFEFIDLAVSAAYVPQYDYEMTGPAELETHKTTLKFPVGVAVEKLTDRKTLMENIPDPVKDMMEKKDSMDLYIALVEILCSGEQDAKTVGWSQSHMQEVVNVLGPKFESKGVTLFLSAKVEEVTENKQSKDNVLLWMEFVDREIQPNYSAQRGVDMKKVPRHGMSATEIVEFSIMATATAADIAMTIMAMTK